MSCIYCFNFPQLKECNLPLIFFKNPKLINDVYVDYVVIGDPAYPLLPWLLKGYTGRVTPWEESFNSYMNSARITVEQTIGRLKSRWRILKKTNEMDYRFIPKVSGTLLSWNIYFETNLNNNEILF